GLLKFQSYIEAVSTAPRTSLNLPKSFSSVAEVEKRMPELVQRRCQLIWKEVKKEEIAQRITLKETWHWEGTEEGWQVLQERFPFLAREQTKSSAGRLNMLDALETGERLKIDAFTRQKILEKHPEWIEEAFDRVSARKEEM